MKPWRIPFFREVKGEPAIEPVRSMTIAMSSGISLHGEHADADVLIPMLLYPSKPRKNVGTEAFCVTVTVFGPLQGRFGLLITQLVCTVSVTFEPGTPPITFLEPVVEPKRFAWLVALVALAG